jgi:hypothetical protein
LEEEFPEYLAANFGSNWISASLAVAVGFEYYQIARTAQRLD